jgi:hypothetical protein
LPLPAKSRSAPSASSRRSPSCSTPTRNSFSIQERRARISRRFFPVRRTGRRIFSNRAHGALGYSMAAAIGAHFARPQVKTVAVMGDGSFGMCAGELETLVRLDLRSRSS